MTTDELQEAVDSLEHYVRERVKEKHITHILDALKEIECIIEEDEDKKLEEEAEAAEAAAVDAAVDEWKERNYDR